MASVKEIIKKAKNYYFNLWRGHEKICPAFGEKVYLTRLGWNHIAHHPRRTLVDKIIRLRKLSLAREVLETATTYQTLKKQKKFYLYGFQAIKEDTRIKVVVASKNEGSRKVLFSVMFKNISKNKQKRIEEENRVLITQFRKKYPRVFNKRRRN